MARRRPWLWPWLASALVAVAVSYAYLSLTGPGEHNRQVGSADSLQQSSSDAIVAPPAVDARSLGLCGKAAPPPTWSSSELASVHGAMSAKQAVANASADDSIRRLLEEYGGADAQRVETMPPGGMVPPDARFRDAYLGELTPGQRVVLQRHRRESKDPATWSLDNDPQAQWNLNALPSYALSVAELEQLNRTGFVVAPSLVPRRDFGSALYGIYASDLPVFFSADAALHAFHVTFETGVAALEEHRLKPMLHQLLSNMTSRLQDLAHAVAPSRITGPNGLRVVLPKDESFRRVLMQAIVDVDVYLTVARSLMVGDLQPLALDLEHIDLHSEFNLLMRHARDELAQLRLLIKAEDAVEHSMFGVPSRLVDFSQLVPRGHYTKSDELSMYFSTMMWLTQVGQFQLRSDGSDSLRATLAPVIAHTLLRKGEQHKLWASIDSVIGSFAGSGPATLSMPQVTDIVADAGGSPQRTDSTPLSGDFIKEQDPTDSTPRSGDFIKEQDPAWAEPDIDWDVVRECHAKAEALRAALASDSTFGIPTYLGSIHADTEHPPRPWHLFSRRFAIDAWAASQVVYEAVPARGVGANKTSRRLPSSMDVAFAVLGNSVGVSQLVDHMRTEPHAASPVRSQLRDGFPYATQLRMARQTVDAYFQDDTRGCGGLYDGWLAALREFSTPPPHPQPVFHSAAWRHREASSQLASWAQLRRDTGLYVQQPHTTIVVTCEFPSVLVEPRPRLWGSLQRLAAQAHDVFEAAGLFAVDESDSSQRILTAVSVGNALDTMLEVLPQLATMAQAHVQGRPLSAAQLDFAQGMVNKEVVGCGTVDYSGWFPRMFPGVSDAARPVNTIVDVHTAPSENTERGHVMHAAVGGVDLAVVSAVDPAFPDKPTLYAGPVFSYHEVLRRGHTRMADRQWATVASTEGRRSRSRPDWVAAFIPSDASLHASTGDT